MVNKTLTDMGKRTMEKRRFAQQTLEGVGIQLDWEPIIESDSVDPDMPDEGNMVQVGWRITVEQGGKTTTQEHLMKEPLPWHHPPGGIWVEME